MKRNGNIKKEQVYTSNTSFVFIFIFLFFFFVLVLVPLAFYLPFCSITERTEEKDSHNYNKKINSKTSQGIQLFILLILQ